jgi:hypothetical protein
MAFDMNRMVASAIEAAFEDGDDEPRRSRHNGVKAVAAGAALVAAARIAVTQAPKLGRVSKLTTLGKVTRVPDMVRDMPGRFRERLADRGWIEDEDDFLPDDVAVEDEELDEDEGSGGDDDDYVEPEAEADLEDEELEEEPEDEADLEEDEELEEEPEDEADLEEDEELEEEPEDEADLEEDEELEGEEEPEAEGDEGPDDEGADDRPDDEDDRSSDDATEAEGDENLEAGAGDDDFDEGAASGGRTPPGLEVDANGDSASLRGAVPDVIGLLSDHEPPPVLVKAKRTKRLDPVGRPPEPPTSGSESSRNGRSTSAKSRSKTKSGSRSKPSSRSKSAPSSKSGSKKAKAGSK